MQIKSQRQKLKSLKNTWDSVERNKEGCPMPTTLSKTPSFTGVFKDFGKLKNNYLVFILSARLSDQELITILTIVITL